MSTSSITISRQRVLCFIGVTPEERAEQQTLEISITFPIPDCSQIAAKDDLRRSVNYHEVSLLINEVAIERPRKLIETLASDIADRVMRQYLMAYVDIEVRKFILPDTEAVIVNFHKTDGKR